MNHQLRKFVNVAQKKTQLSLILVIAASCLIFSINNCKFVLYEQLIKIAWALGINMQGA